MEGPPIKYYIMGINEWRGAHHWPPKEAKDRIYYLSQGQQPERGNAGGYLSPLPSSDIGKVHYVYDPMDPVPSLGSPMVYGNGLEGPQGAKFNYGP